MTNAGGGTITDATTRTLEPVTTAAGFHGPSLYVLEPVPNLDGRVDWRRERDLARAQLAARVEALRYHGRHLRQCGESQREQRQQCQLLHIC